MYDDEEETKAKDKIETAEDKAVVLLEKARAQTNYKDNLKQVIISVCVGACVAFFTSLFQGLAEVLKTHAVDIISGGASATVYLAKQYRG